MALTAEDHRRFYDRIAGYYDLIADSGEAKARQSGEEALGVRPGERVLEIGYGTGHVLVELAGHAGPTGKVTGIDISTGMRDQSRRRLESRPDLAERVVLDVGDARRLPYADGSFDAAFSSFTLELFEDADVPGVLRELSRVLVPGGRLGLVSMGIPEDPRHPGAIGSAYVWMHRHFPHVVDCHPIAVRRLLEQTGYSIVSADRIEIWTLPVDIVVARRGA